MKYSIWQLPVSHYNCFKGSMFKLNDIKLIDYVHVYTGTLDNKEVSNALLDYIFEILNTDHPKDYFARSLSVSDIIQLDINESERLWYYVDSFGFKMLDEKELIGDK